MLAPNADKSTRQQLLTASGQTGASYKSPLNVTLIESDKAKILVDVGSGTRFMDSAGKLEEGLAESNVDPDTITHVIFTHAHPDHLWGTINDFDEVAYPNAKFYISQDEWNYWMGKDLIASLPDERKAFGVGAQRNLKAIKDKITMVKPGQEIMPGIQVLDTSGHTPGHISLEIGDAKSSLVVLGDAITHPKISFAYPSWRTAMDTLPDQAIKTRQRLLDKLAKDGTSIIGYHLPTPGMGRVERKGNTFRYAPMS